MSLIIRRKAGPQKRGYKKEALEINNIYAVLLFCFNSIIIACAKLRSLNLKFVLFYAFRMIFLTRIKLKLKLKPYGAPNIVLIQKYIYNSSFFFGHQGRLLVEAAIPDFN